MDNKVNLALEVFKIKYGERIESDKTYSEYVNFICTLHHDDEKLMKLLTRKKHLETLVTLYDLLSDDYLTELKDVLKEAYSTFNLDTPYALKGLEDAVNWFYLNLTVLNEYVDRKIYIEQVKTKGIAYSITVRRIIEYCKRKNISVNSFLEEVAQTSKYVESLQRLKLYESLKPDEDSRHKKIDEPFFDAELQKLSCLSRNAKSYSIDFIGDHVLTALLMRRKYDSSQINRLPELVNLLKELNLDMDLDLDEITTLPTLSETVQILKGYGFSNRQIGSRLNSSEEYNILQINTILKALTKLDVTPTELNEADDMLSLIKLLRNRIDYLSNVASEKDLSVISYFYSIFRANTQTLPFFCEKVAELYRKTALKNNVKSF